MTNRCSKTRVIWYRGCIPWSPRPPHQLCGGGVSAQFRRRVTIVVFGRTGWRQRANIGIVHDHDGDIGVRRFVRRRWQTVSRHVVQPPRARLQVLDHPLTGYLSPLVRPLFGQQLLDLSYAPPVSGRVYFRSRRWWWRSRGRRIPLQVPDCHLQDVSFFQFVHSGEVLPALQSTNNDNRLINCSQSLKLTDGLW